MPTQIDVSETAEVTATNKIKFDALSLEASVQRGIDALGFEFCSPIQGQILPHTLGGNDAIGKAQTGTGKTAAFLITIFNDLLAILSRGSDTLVSPGLSLLPRRVNWSCRLLQMLRNSGDLRV